MAHALHHVAIAAESVGVVVEEWGFGGIEAGFHHVFGDSHADGVGDALTERACCGFNADGASHLGMAWRIGAELAELLEVVDGDRKSCEMEKRVEQGRAVTTGEDEAVAVGPLGVCGRGVQVFQPEDGGNVCHAQRETGMSRVCLLDGVHGETSDDVCC